MKELLLPYLRWAVAGAILLAVALLLALGVGRRRGSALYGLRIGLWQAALLVMTGGGVVVSAACTRAALQADAAGEQDGAAESGLPEEPEGASDGPAGVQGDPSLDGTQASDGPAAADAGEKSGKKKKKKGAKGSAAKDGEKTNKKHKEIIMTTCYL
jgi:hypothetical protein